MNDVRETWQPGDLVLFSDHRSTHHGGVGRLELRFTGQISNRPYWTIRLLANGAIASEFEDSLVRAPEGGR